MFIIDKLNLELQKVAIDSIVQGNTLLRRPNLMVDKWQSVMDASAKGSFDDLAGVGMNGWGLKVVKTYA